MPYSNISPMTPPASWMTAVFRRHLEAGPVCRKHVEDRSAEERVKGRVKDGPVVRSSSENIAVVRSFLEGGGRDVEVWQWL